MKKFIFLFLLTVPGISAYAQKGDSQTGNPLFPGYYADPFAVSYDGVFWIYPTYSAEFKKQVYLDAFSSTDLKNWKKHPRIIDTTAVKWARMAMWAPSALRKDGKYFLFFAANDIHQGETGGIGVAVADRPEGPFADLLGKPLISTIVNGAQPIDQHVFQDDDSTYYMYYGGWGHCNVVQLNSNLSGLVPFSDGTVYKEVTPKGYVEGPFMFKRNGAYYFMWSEGNWGDDTYNVAYAIAKSPLGPFNREGTLLIQNKKIGKGAGHHSILALSNPDRYHIVYHRRPPAETDANSRVVCIEELKFSQDGKIMPVMISNEGVTKLK
jgi:beta-xylosidase